MIENRTHQAEAIRSRSTTHPPSTRGPPNGPEIFPIVGIGAAAGYVDACRVLVDALPAGVGIAFIVVQHLDALDDTLLPALLTSATSLVLCEAEDGLMVEREHIYVVPINSYLSIENGILRLSGLPAGRGSDLPFDFFLNSLALDCGDRAACVVLSGNGVDGSLGLQAVKQSGGLVIAQDPSQSAYAGMPNSAVLTGAVDLVLPVAEIPSALIDFGRRFARAPTRTGSIVQDNGEDHLPEIIDLLRRQTAHDFTFYKRGTLQRRIQHRMALAAIPAGDLACYLQILKHDVHELDLLAQDLSDSEKLLLIGFADEVKHGQRQSPDEELSEVNAELRDVLERERATSSDLRNILNSSDVATLLLDRDLNIRFFTPAIRSMFSLISSDIGRPLVDFRSLGTDPALLSDAAEVLRTLVPMEREIEGKDGVRYIRRISPCPGQNGIGGVVLTFRNLTERRNIVKSLEDAKQLAEQATAAKSRLLATASHDLRQPLQTLAMLHGMLAEGKNPKDLIGQLDQTLGTMSGMLSTLLDVDQFDLGSVRPIISEISIDWLFGRLKDEFTYRAHADGLSLHIVPCHLSVDSDPRLLKQMIRILLMNAIAYTKSGKLLLGCRRRDGILSIEVGDTGVGTPDTVLQSMFEPHIGQRGSNLANGGGLSIFKDLADLLGHRVSARSKLGKGSIFSIEIQLSLPAQRSADIGHFEHVKPKSKDYVSHARSILVVDESQEQRQIFEQVLKNEGHEITTASNGASALALVTHGAIRPDLVITDYRLPHGMNGLELGSALRERLHHEVPLIILSADILASTSDNGALRHCEQLRKPLKLRELRHAIQRLIPGMHSVDHPSITTSAAVEASQNTVIFVVDDDSHIRSAFRSLLESEGMIVEDFASCEAFLLAYRPEQEGCLLIDAYLPGISGLELLDRLAERGHALATVMITGNGDIPMATKAMKAGASNFLVKPVGRSELLASIETALSEARDHGILFARREAAADQVSGLTVRQRQVMELVLAGHPSKNIAADLGLSQRTVENHRASVMRKTGTKSLPALARLVVAATSDSAKSGSSHPAPAVER